MIYLITDYGLEDYFVSALKNVILNSCNLLKIPFPTIIDISHNLPNHNVVAAIINIKALLDLMPDRSIILAIVDPEVGSNIEGCVSLHVYHQKYIYLVGRNNGILGALYPHKHVYTYKISSRKIENNIKNKGIFYQAGIRGISNTFHGRDIFAPIASILLHDIKTNSNLLREFIGQKVKPLYYKIPKPLVKNKTIIGKIIYFDHFGNAITNISSNLLNKKIKQINLKLKDQVLFSIPNISKNYLEGKNQQIIAIANSFGYLEFSKYKSSVRELLGDFENIMVEVLMG
ncbi:MAG: SAM-dependent chlorinase/fluorinase [bacterium]